MRVFLAKKIGIGDRSLLLAFFLSGAAALGYELLWTRLLGLALNRRVYQEYLRYLWEVRDWKSYREVKKQAGEAGLGGRTKGPEQLAE